MVAYLTGVDRGQLLTQTQAKAEVAHGDAGTVSSLIQVIIVVLAGLVIHEAFEALKVSLAAATGERLQQGHLLGNRNHRTTDQSAAMHQRWWS